MERTGTPIEVSTWDWEERPVYDRYGNIRHYQRVRVPREYRELEYEQPEAEPLGDDWEWEEF